MKTKTKKTGTLEDIKKHHEKKHYGHKPCARGECRGHGSLFFGSLFIFFGIILLLRKMGVSIPFISIIGEYWPVGLILVGLAWIFKKRGLGFLLLFLTFIVATMHVFTAPMDMIEASRETTLIRPMDPNVNELELELNFGAGVVSIEGNSVNLMENHVRTNIGKDPKIRYNKEESKVYMQMDRSEPSQFSPSAKEEWEIKLNNNIPTDLDLNYGAAEIYLDLSDLMINNLDIETGASETNIIFADYPTKVSIESGMNSINMKFPKESQVKITTEGVVEQSFHGMYKQNGIYYSDSFDENKEPIEISIEGGLVGVEAEFI